MPIFFIINGFFFFNAIQKKKEVVWLKRIAILYVFWMIIYFYSWNRLDDFNLMSLLKMLKTLVFGHFHLWYLPSVILAAMCFICICNMLSDKWLLILSVFLFLCGCLLQYASVYDLMEFSQFNDLINRIELRRNFLFFALPFFIIGFLLNKYAVKDKVSMSTVVMLLFVSLLLLPFESLINYNQLSGKGGFDLTIMLIIAAPILFLLFVKVRCFKQIHLVSILSSGLYFIHPIFLDFLKILNLQSFILGLTVIILTSASTLLLSRNKFFRHIAL